MTGYPEVPDFDDAITGAMASGLISHGGSTLPFGAQKIDWRHLTAADAPEAWTRLREWVEWFTVRYDIPLSTVPVCWWKHPSLVEELSALCTAHQAAFDAADTSHDPIWWHEHLAAALPRIHRAYAGGCSRGHNTVRPRSWDGTTDEQEWTAWTAQAHAHRDAAAPPEGRKAG